MLQAWFPPAWALAGSLIAIATIGVPGFFMNTYIGGSIPATGGALLLGALPRLARRPGTRNALWMAAGWLLLLHSRPFEGMALTLTTAVILLFLWYRKGLLSRRLFLPVFAPLGAMIVTGLALTCFYNLQVTGDPLKMPYQVNRETYGWPENLAILPPVAVQHRHYILSVMHQQELEHRDIYSSFGRLIDNVITRIADSWAFYIGPLLTIPMLFLLRRFQDRRTRILLAIAILMCGLNALQLVLYPPHLAAISVVFFALVTQGLRHLYVTMRRHSPARLARFAAAACVCLVLIGAIRFYSPKTSLVLTFWQKVHEKHRDARAAVVARLEQRISPQLIMVRYRSDHSPHQEWVYNSANIDKSKLVWAREMDPAANQALLKYFANREAWLLEPDTLPLRLTPYLHDQSQLSRR